MNPNSSTPQLIMVLRRAMRAGHSLADAARRHRSVSATHNQCLAEAVEAIRQAYRIARREREQRRQEQE